MPLILQKRHSIARQYLLFQRGMKPDLRYLVLFVGPGGGPQLPEKGYWDRLNQSSRGGLPGAWHKWPGCLGLGNPGFMRATWFKKKDYKVVDKQKIMRLLWKPFNNEAIPPKMIKSKEKPTKGKEKVNITMFRNGWCPAMNLVYERALRASQDFESKIHIEQYDTVDREVLDEWGIADGLYIDGKAVRMGPPPTYDKIPDF